MKSNAVSPREQRVMRTRCLYTLGQRDYKGRWPIRLKAGGQVVGFLAECWGKDAGWFYRTIGGDWSLLPLKTKKEAIMKLGESL